MFWVRHQGLAKGITIATLKVGTQSNRWVMD